jgi:hypothetical protein
MTPLVGLVIASLAWGALAFGGNYPWAYGPLLAAVSIAGAGLARSGRGPAPRRTLIALATVGAAVALQLLPLDSRILSSVSPAAVDFLRGYDVAFAISPDRHPLSIAPSRTLLALVFLAALAALVAGVARIDDRRQLRSLVGALIVLGAVMAVIGIVQRATFNGRIYGFWTPINAATSPFGPFVNKNHFAGWMLMAAPLAFGMLAAALHRDMPGGVSLRDRLLWLSTPAASRAMLIAFAAFLMGLALVLTTSRSGVISFGVAVMLSLAWSVRRGSVRRRALFGASVFLMCVLPVGVAGVDLLAARFGQADTSTLGDRLPIWADTARVIADFWVTGTGLNTYGAATLLYQTARPFEHLREAHSDYLQLAAEGVLLLGVPILLAVTAFAGEVRQRFRSGDRGTSYWIRCGAVTGLAAIAVQSSVEFSLQMPGNAALFAVLCGIALHSGGSHPPEQPVARPNPFPRR